MYEVVMPETIPVNGNIEVFFGRNIGDVDAAIFAPPYAMITPDYNTWNDYGFGFFADLVIRLKDNSVLELNIRIMFEDVDRSAGAIDALLVASQNAPVSVDSVEKRFVSLLYSTDDYRSVLGALGFDVGVILLRKLHDAVIGRIEGGPQESLDLIDTDRFHVGVLRLEGAYEAFYSGKRHIRADVPTPVSDVAGQYEFHATLPNAENRFWLEFDFRPDPIFHDRACVLVGRNGTGKTQLLKSVVEALARQAAIGETTDDGEDQPVAAGFEPHLDVSRVLVFSSVPTDPFPKAIAPWKGIDYEYFAVNTSVTQQPAALIGALLTCWRDRPSPLDGGGSWSREDVLSRMLGVLGMRGSLYLPLRIPDGPETLTGLVHYNGRPYFPFHRSLNEQGGLRLSHRVDWELPPEVFDANYAPRTLSSGEHALLRMSAQMVAAIETGSLLLLDEPETHLHPNYISELMSALHELLAVTRSAAIIATHSSYVVREVGRDRISVIDLKEGRVEIARPRMQTFGSSIDAISQFIFRDSTLEHRFQQSLERWLATDAQGLSIEAIVEQYGSHLNSEALSYVARTLKSQNGGDIE
jgi:predicted ATPase